MKTRINLLEVNILPALSALALPIMATSLIQMAYNLIDMIWIGKIGASAVASVGAAGMFKMCIRDRSSSLEAMESFM